MQHANLNIVAPVSNLIPRPSLNLGMGFGNETTLNLGMGVGNETTLNLGMGFGHKTTLNLGMEFGNETTLNLGMGFGNETNSPFIFSHHLCVELPHLVACCKT